MRIETQNKEQFSPNIVPATRAAKGGERSRARPQRSGKARHMIINPRYITDRGGMIRRKAGNDDYLSYC